jgi:superfamily II DNA or RNA helicase
MPALVPDQGQLVEVRRRRFVVTAVKRSGLQPDPLKPIQEGPQHLVSLSSVEDDAYGEELEVVWELEPGARAFNPRELPEPSSFDEPRRFDAFLDSVRWGAVSSADVRALQAPFRSGIAIEDFQLDPVARALQMPRVNLLIADDVGLGKTIEAGLVLQELLLRHRARRILVLCPASLQIKWRDELRDKFGLEFRIVDTELMRDLRRRRGVHVNPWGHFPRLITSFDYLKRDRPLQLFRQELPAPGEPVYPRRFDLLILDEAHNLAPAGRGPYATDSIRTRMLGEIAPHFEHKLFLTATPHNGYRESFTALLALLDDQRFARGVSPDPVQLQAVMVRRLKDEPEIREWDGRKRFHDRRLVPLEVDYSEVERAAHRALQSYGASLLARTREAGLGFAAEFVLKLLKKRLFSSPEAFRATLAKHADWIGKKRREGDEASVSVRALQRQADDLDEEYADDESYETTAGEVVGSASQLLPTPTREEREHLRTLALYAADAVNRPDGKAKRLIKFLGDTIKPGGRWGDERAIVFTEYRATQKWLMEQLANAGFTGQGRIMLLYGGMPTDERESIKAAFQARSDVSDVRILLATDAASEGIDLQNHCHRLVHYEIPWNPIRLEQRNGRVDRRGQKQDVDVYHFVAKGYEQGREDPAQPPGELEGDLEFLARVVEKVERIRHDLGKVGPVIARQVEEAMLGSGRRRLDTTAAECEAEPVRRLLTFQRRLADQLRRLHDQLHETKSELRLTPENVRNVVAVGLEVAGKPPLIAAEVPGLWPDPDGRRRESPAFRLPPLDGSWALCGDGLAHPHTGEIRPIVFDPDLADGRDEVVLAHLNHRLVAMCLRLLRGEVWALAGARKLNRVTARLVPDSALAHPAAIAHGRIVVLGGDQRRVHEQVIAAGGLLREGRFERLNVGQTDAALAAALPYPTPAAVCDRIAGLWPSVREPLLRALEARMRDLAEGLGRKLEERAAAESKAIESVLRELERAIREELGSGAPEQQELWAPEAREQRERDREALQDRLARIPSEIVEEQRLIAARYAAPQPRLFPVAISFLVPERLAR